MKLKKIKISGWRSFDENGVILDVLKKNNIIIGPNNSGKSNVAKYFLYLKSIAGTLSERKDNSLLFHNIEHETIDTDTWAWLSNDMYCELELQLENNSWSDSVLKPNLEEEITLKVRHRVSEKYIQLYIAQSGKDIICIDKPYKILNKQTNNYQDITNNIDYVDDSYIYWKAFLDSLLFIDPIRHHNRDSKESTDFYFDGAKILETLYDVNKKQVKIWSAYINKMYTWLSEILNENVTGIDVSKDDYRIHINRGGQNLISSLPQLGTGVSQVVMLLSYLYLNMKKKLNVFLEEPESNLHPDSVVKLIDIFNREFPEHVFFITTHSSILIDQLDDTWSINKISREANNASKIYSCENIVHKYELLDDLGIRASQLLQSNMIIWVEGPSDAIYLKKWIEDISKSKLAIGKDYSFVFYGGSNLTHHNILSTDDIHSVDFMYTSRYVAIFCDSDCKSKDEYDNFKFKERVNNISQRLLDLRLSNEGCRTDIREFVNIWITTGRETENYIPKTLMSDILSSDNFRKKYIRIGKTKHNISIDDTLRDNISFSCFESFDVAFSKMYKYENKKDIDVSLLDKISSHYSSDKINIAREVVKRWKDEYYSDELKKQIENLVKMISKANGKRYE